MLLSDLVFLVVVFELIFSFCWLQSLNSMKRNYSDFCQDTLVNNEVSCSFMLCSFFQFVGVVFILALDYLYLTFFSTFLFSLRRSN